jgi:hypothetical protein|tara:strand:- start:865 stop:1080 length:216 start_codon:yes stop_codon:yes gene_type:complete
MKVGDLIKVRYQVKNAYDRSFERWGEDHIGVLVETPEVHDNALYQMWCFKSQAIHILMPDRDLIEVLNESR